jgi:hypothetical protein
VKGALEATTPKFKNFLLQAQLAACKFEFKVLSESGKSSSMNRLIALSSQHHAFKSSFPHSLITARLLFAEARHLVRLDVYITYF